MPLLDAVNGLQYAVASLGAPRRLGGIEEYLFVYDNGDPMTPELVQSWSYNDQGTQFTFTLKEGIPFNPPRGLESVDFGEVNALEVTAWLNRLNSRTNPGSVAGDAGDYAAVFGTANNVDDYTVVLDLWEPVFHCVPLSQYGCLNADRGISKVTHADTYGEAWALDHHVGTGPFVLGQCRANDSCTLHAVENHWRQTPRIAEYKGIHVPDGNSRLSLVRTGLADIAEVSYGLLSEVNDDSRLRFLNTMPGSYVGESVMFSGNMWEEIHARERYPLNSWNSEPYLRDYPWIGDPWQEQWPGLTRYQDTDNPPGMTDMEQARLVRLALSTAIDRNRIAFSIFDGMGIPLYSEYMGPEYPGWDPDRLTGAWDYRGNRIQPSATVQPVRWKLDDAEFVTAGDLLTAAGYPIVGGSRPNFGTIVLERYSAELGDVNFAMADFIAADWRRLGIDVQLENVNYGGDILPRMQQRNQFNPILKNGDVHSNVIPLDHPFPATDTSATRPAWGTGIESPAAARWLFAMFAERDKARREAIHLDWVDYSVFWVQYAGVVQAPKGVIVNDRIASWVGRQEFFTNVSRNPEFIVLN